MVRAGAAWRMMPHDLPPWYTVYQQSQRWFKAGVFETMVIDLRELLRLAKGRNPQPSAAIRARSAPTTSAGSCVRSRMTCQRIAGSASSSQSMRFTALAS